MIKKSKKFASAAIAVVLCLIMTISTVYAATGNGAAIGESVSISLENIEMLIGETQKIDAVINEDKINNDVVIYQTDKDDVLEISQNGDVTALSEGEAEVYATDEKGAQISNKVKITVYAEASITEVKAVAENYIGSAATAPVENETEFLVEDATANQYGDIITDEEVTSNKVDTGVVTLNRTAFTLGVGEGYNLVSTITETYNTNQIVNWASDNKKVATVDGKGSVKAVGTGKAVVTASLENGSKASCTVTVKKAPTSVKISPTSVTLGVGETYTISQSSPADCYAKGFNFTSSNTSVATVEKTTANKAKVVAKGVGTATITVKTYNGKTSKCTVTVKSAPSSVKMSTTKFTLGVGESNIISQSSPANCYAKGFEFTSSNTSVATVEKTTANKAKVVAKGTGTATITVETYNGKKATCTVTVKKAPTSVTLGSSSLSLNKGDSKIISQSSPSNCYAKGFEFTSSNTSVATVEKTTANKAKVVAKGAGTATITVKTYNGKTATCKVTVSERSYTDDDLYCLTAVVWQESGSYWLSDTLQIYVANVVLNRVDSSYFPNTIRGVLTSPYAYGPMAYSGIHVPTPSNAIEKAALERCYKNAKKVLEGYRPLPKNVVFQAGFVQGNGIYAYESGLYFCYL